MVLSHSVVGFYMVSRHGVEKTNMVSRHGVELALHGVESI